MEFLRLKHQPSLVMAVLICLGLLWPEMTTTTQAAVIFLSLCRLYFEFSKTILFPRWITNSAAVLLSVAIYFEYKTLFGRDASTQLLSIFTLIKACETRTLRDLRFFQILILALLATKFLFSFDVWLLGPGLAVIFFVFFSLLPPFWTAEEKSKWLLKSLALALPLGLILFAIFPRNKNPWHWNIQNRDIARTGFGDELTPGSVSSLEDDRRVAFRFQWLKPEPGMTPETLYFVGLRLNQSEGLSWKRAKSASLSARSSSKIQSSIMDYEILLEPHGAKWIFTLEDTGLLKIFERTYDLTDEEFLLNQELTERIQYQGKIKDPQKASREEPIQLNFQVSKELEIWLNENFPQISTPEDFANALGTFYQREGFQYSRQVALGSTLESFLLNEKSGYCEHYAGATASLLLLKGFHARVVVGYLDAEKNPLSEFYTVRQNKAHAWVEFLDSQGLWQRFDPTAGLRQRTLPLQNWLQQLQSQLSGGYDLINYRWNKFLVEFDRSQQRKIWEQMAPTLKFVAALLVIGAVLINLNLLRTRKSPHRKRNKAYEAWLQFEADLKKQGLHRTPAETPYEFSKRINTPQAKQAFKAYADSNYLRD
jgi:hypothetical protein